jgi:membrane dipeptidase
MLPDEGLKAMAEKEGVVGIETAGWGHRTEKHPEDGLDGFMEQVVHCVETLGVDHVAIGPDTMYGDHTALYKAGYENRKKGGTGTYSRPSFKWDEEKEGVIKHDAQKQAFEDPDFYVKGLENPSDFVNIVKWLVKNGYSDKEIIKIIGGNTLRVLEKVWP